MVGHQRRWRCCTWLSKPRWRIGTPNTNPAPSPSSGSPGTTRPPRFSADLKPFTPWCMRPCTPPVKPPRRSTRLGLLRRPIGCSRRWRHRSTWQIWHVRAEAQRQIRAANITANRAEQLVDLLVAEVLNTKPIPLMPPDNAIVEPVPLRRADGSSVYAVAGADLFTSARILRQVQWNLVSSPPQQVLGRVPLTLRQQVADLRAVITDLLPIAVLSELSRRHPSHDAVRTLVAR
jgi:hypothetical protein